ncbi:MAG: hypothetical protein K0U72_01545 [Gammaproteobacteria bacterium]|nr:hypothetical protein [Gammaproteobacteria bacterium]
MPRQIDYSPGDSGDGWTKRLLKSIPSEVVAFHIAVIGVISGAGAPDWLLWIALGVSTVATPLWMIFHEKVNNSVTQIILATGAVSVWDMSLAGGAFQSIDGFAPFIGSIILLTYTMVISPLVTLMVRGVSGD